MCQLSTDLQSDRTTLLIVLSFNHFIINLFNYPINLLINLFIQINLIIFNIKGVPKKVSHSDFRVYVGQNKYYQYVLNFWFDNSNNYGNKIRCPT